jgi:WD40 repeat protein
VTKLGVAGRDDAASWSPPARPHFPGTLIAALRLRRLAGFRLTPLKATVLAVLLFVAGMYTWGVFFYEEEGKQPSIEVQWLEVDSPLAAVVEREHPYAASIIGDVDDTWRAYVVRGSSQPRLAFETDRRLLSTSWSSDGGQIVVSFASQAASTETLTGYAVFDAVTGRELRQSLLPFSGMTRVSRGAERVALTSARVGSSTSRLYVIDAEGAARQLSAAWSYTSPVSWSPDGRWLLVSAFSEAASITDGEKFYAVSPFDEGAIDLGRFRVAPSWSPDSTSVAGFEGADLVVRRLDNARETRAVIGPRLQNASTGQLAPGPAWSPDGRYVGYSGAAIDASSGRVLSRPDDALVTTSVSPDGKRLAASSGFATCGAATSGSRNSPSPTRTTVKDIASGRQSTLLDCGAGAFSPVQWLSPDALLLTGVACTSGCTGPTLVVVLASVPDGKLTYLTDPAGEATGGLAVSPDGQRVLVGGKALRVYAANGSLLRTIPAPQDLFVTGLSWSGDGQSFTYIVGPRTRGGTSGAFAP